jgi:hypothetical protein
MARITQRQLLDHAAEHGYGMAPFIKTAKAA